MFAGIHHSLSGLAAAQNRINTAAHNIANAHTPEFKKSRAIFEESTGGGVQVSLGSENTPGPVVLQETEEELIAQEFSNVNLEEELVNLLLGQRSFEVNVRAIEVQDDALGSLLDIHE